MADQPTTTSHQAAPAGDKGPTAMSWIKSSLVLIILGLIAYFGFRHFYSVQQAAVQAKSDLKSRPATVTAVPAQTADMKVYLNAIGTVTPRNVVVG